MLEPSDDARLTELSDLRVTEGGEWRDLETAVDLPLSPVVVGGPGVSPNRWTWAVGPWQTMPSWQLTDATSRRVTWRLGEPSDASFTLDGTSRDAGQVQELVTDLWVFYNGVPLYRGRVGPLRDTIDGSAHTLSVATADYRGVLTRRLLFEGDTLTYTQQDQSTIAWALVSTTQNRGALGIVRGVGHTTGVLRDRTYEPGETVGHYIDQLSQVQDGFEWDVTPTASTALNFDVFYPIRGTDRQEVLDYPGRIRSLTRSTDPGKYANSLRVTGGEGTTPVRVDAPDLASLPEGRWDIQVGETTILEAPTLAARAQAELVEASTVTPSWSAVLTPNAWGGPSHIWLGDPVALAVKSGRLNVVASYRVQELTVDLDSEGSATVALVLGAVPPDRRFLLRKVNQRLTSLERR